MDTQLLIPSNSDEEQAGVDEDDCKRLEVAYDVIYMYITSDDDDDDVKTCGLKISRRLCHVRLKGKKRG